MTKEKHRLASYKATIHNGIVQALSLAIAEKVLPSREASVVVKAFMRNHEMAFSSSSHGPDSIDAKVRRYFFICKPSLTARRKLFRTLIRFVSEQNWSEQHAVSALIQDIQEQLHLSPRRVNSSARGGASRTNSTRTRATFSARSKDACPPPKWIKILDCPPNASLEVIKRAYRKKVLELHPDRFQGKGLSKEEVRSHYNAFHEVQEAYELALATVKGEL